MELMDKTWHLASTEDEIKITEFELQLWRTFSAFTRWQEDCEQSTNNSSLTANDIAVLHIIRMKDRPKSIYDIGRLMNRTDTYNIYYSVKRLLNLKLISVSKSTDKKIKEYAITPAGIENTDAYTQSRRTVLINLFIKELNLDFEQLSKSLAILKAVYDEADRAAVSYIIPHAKKTGKKVK